MAVICIAIIILVAGIDLGVKWWVERKVAFREDKRILGGKGILRRVHNKGMMLSFAQRYNKVVRVVSAGLTVILACLQVILLIRPEYEKEKIGLSLLLGGALSNSIDRMKRGYVVDYLAFNSKNKKISNVTYNIGDFAIFAGGILIILASMLKKK